MANELWQISPIDGRYSDKTSELRELASEAGLIRYRIMVEVEWLIALSEEKKIVEISLFSDDQQAKLRDLYLNYTPEIAERVKKIEKTTNHDVKAIEYYLKEAGKDIIPGNCLEFIHFACTSEDINSTAYALMVRDLTNELLLQSSNFMNMLKAKVMAWKSVPLLSRTHGQPASPSTVGKEFLVFYSRLKRQFEHIEAADYFAKMSGAVGNFNAHLSAYPDINWESISRKVIEEKLNLKANPVTTQIEPHDYMAEIFDSFSRIASILIDFSRDIWMYISIDYIKQATKKGEVGSSTMPHKVNPIDFENAEGNLLLARNLFRFLSDKLPLSRLQRDLTDSTTLRNIGSGFAYLLISIKSLVKGMSKISVNEEAIDNDLEAHWEVLAEPVQTVMKKHGILNPYEMIKELTRGKSIDKKTLISIIENLEIPDAAKGELLKLNPQNYIGNAVEQVEEYFKDKK